MKNIKLIIEKTVNPLTESIALLTLKTEETIKVLEKIIPFYSALSKYLEMQYLLSKTPERMSEEKDFKEIKRMSNEAEENLLKEIDNWVMESDKKTPDKIRFLKE